MQEVEAPDGTIIEFPDGMTDEQILGVMRRNYGKQSSASPVAEQPPLTAPPAAANNADFRPKYPSLPQLDNALRGDNPNMVERGAQALTNTVGINPALVRVPTEYSPSAMRRTYNLMMRSANEAATGLLASPALFSDAVFNAGAAMANLLGYDVEYGMPVTSKTVSFLRRYVQPKIGQDIETTRDEEKAMMLTGGPAGTAAMSAAIPKVAAPILNKIGRLAPVTAGNLAAVVPANAIPAASLINQVSGAVGVDNPLLGIGIGLGAGVAGGVARGVSRATDAVKRSLGTNNAAVREAAGRVLMNQAIGSDAPNALLPDVKKPSKIAKIEAETNFAKTLQSQIDAGLAEAPVNPMTGERMPIGTGEAVVLGVGENRTGATGRVPEHLMAMQRNTAGTVRTKGLDDRQFDFIRKTLEGGMPEGGGIAEVGKGRARLVEKLDMFQAQAKEAIKSADMAQAEVNAKVPFRGKVLDASEKARAVIDSAYDTGREVEKAMWNLAAEKANNPVVKTELVADLLDRASFLKKLETSEEDIPAAVKQLLDRVEKLTVYQTVGGKRVKVGYTPVPGSNRLKTATFTPVPGEKVKAGYQPLTIDDVNQAISRINRDIRIANGQSTPATAANIKRLNDIRSGLEDIRQAALSQSPGAVEATDAARAFSTSFNDTFTRGKIGSVLGYDKRGGARIAPELTLDQLLSRAREGRQQLKTAAGGPAAIAAKAKVALPGDLEAATISFDRAIESNARVHAIKDFIEETSSGGKIDLTKANKWIGDNADLFDAQDGWPVIENDLREIMKSQRNVNELRDAAASIIDKAEAIEAQNGIRRFIETDPAKLVEGIVSMNDPISAAKNIRKEVDPDTWKALRRVFWEDFMRRSEAKSARSTATGAPEVSDSILSKMMDKNEAFMREGLGYTQAEMQQIATARRALDIVTRRRGMRTLGGSDTAPNEAFMKQVQGSGMGIIMDRMVGGHTFGGLARVVASSLHKMLSQKTDTEISALLAEAMADPAVSKALLSEVNATNEAAVTKIIGDFYRLGAKTAQPTGILIQNTHREEK